MKLLYYVGTGSNKFGGLEKFNMRVFRRLKERGIGLVLVYRRPIVDGPFKAFLDQNGIKYRWLWDSFAIAGESKTTNARRLAKIVAAERPDLIHYNFGNLYDIALTRLRNPLLRYRAIYTAHCHTNLSNPYLRTVHGLIASFADRVLGVSQAITDDFDGHLKFARAQTLYLGVPQNGYTRADSRRKYGFADNEIIIVNIAYHDPIKGVDVLIRAAHHLLCNLGIDNFRVIQIGGSPFKESANALKAMPELQALGRHFEMWGLRDDVEQIMAGADIYCQPSRSEGIPLSIMEAGMAAVPVVAANVGGMAEAARHGQNAILCVKEDHTGIAASLRLLIEDPELRRQMGLAGKRIADKHFNIDSQADRLVEIYTQVAKNK